MTRILPAIILAVLFHVALFTIDPGLLIKKPGGIKKPAITVTMSYRKKPAPPPSVKKPPEIKKKKKVAVVEKIREPAPVKEQIPVNAPEPVKEQDTAEKKAGMEEESVEQLPAASEDIEKTEASAEGAVTGVKTEAIPLYRINPEPGYPRVAKKRGYQGTVLLSVLVSKDGKVDDLWLFESSGYKILDNAAIRAVKEWTFEPGRIGDETVDMWVEVPVRFEIK